MFCGGGLGFVGWVKQRAGHPLVNISCSLTSLAIITVLTKEGAVQAALFSDDKVTQVMIMILMGVFATTAVSFAIWPISAREELKGDLVQVTDSFGAMLTMITRAFLTGSEEELQHQQYIEASAKYKKVFTSLTKNLKEAKYEHYIVGREEEYRLEAKLVNCMQRLAQNIGGLRSAATTQFLLLAQPETLSQLPPWHGSAKSKRKGSHFPPEADDFNTPLKSSGTLAAIDETPEDMSGASSPSTAFTTYTPNSTRYPFLDGENHLPRISSPSGIFSRFIVQLGPSMVNSVTVPKFFFSY